MASANSPVLRQILWKPKRACRENCGMRIANQQLVVGQLRFHRAAHETPQAARADAGTCAGNRDLGAQRRQGRRANRPPGRRGRGCRRWCRACARRDRRCRGRPAPESPPVGSDMRPSSMAACVTVAPMVMASLSSVTAASSGMRLMSTRTGRLRKAQIEHGTQRLAARQNLGVRRCRQQRAAASATVCGRT